MNVDILNELQAIFRDLFDDESIVLTDETSAKDIEDWDSLAQMRLVIAIEKHFRVKFNYAETKKLQNIGDMVKLIQSHLTSNA